MSRHRSSSSWPRRLPRRARSKATAATSCSVSWRTSRTSAYAAAWPSQQPQSPLPSLFCSFPPALCRVSDLRFGHRPLAFDLARVPPVSVWQHFTLFVRGSTSLSLFVLQSERELKSLVEAAKVDVISFVSGGKEGASAVLNFAALPACRLCRWLPACFLLSAASPCFLSLSPLRDTCCVVAVPILRCRRPCPVLTPSRWCCPCHCNGLRQGSGRASGAVRPADAQARRRRWRPGSQPISFISAPLLQLRFGLSVSFVACFVLFDGGGAWFLWPSSRLLCVLTPRLTQLCISVCLCRAGRQGAGGEERRRRRCAQDHQGLLCFLFSFRLSPGPFAFLLPLIL